MLDIIMYKMRFILYIVISRIYTERETEGELTAKRSLTSVSMVQWNLELTVCGTLRGR